MQRSGFTFIEAAVLVALIGISAMLSMPMYNSFRIRSDLRLAASQTQQGVNRARLLAQNYVGNSRWGFYVPSGTLYKGADWPSRDPAFDEMYDMPSSISLSGITDVSFAPDGSPSVTGDIVLRALTQDEEVIPIRFVVTSNQLVTQAADILVVCDQGVTRTIVEAAWPGYQAGGATLGACGGSVSTPASSVTSSVASSVEPPTSSSASSVMSSSSSSQISLPSCAMAYNTATQVIQPLATMNVQLESYIARINYGTQSDPPLASGNGPRISVYYCYGEYPALSGPANSWSAVWGGNAICSNTSNGNATGTAVAYSSAKSATIHEIDSDKRFALKVVGRYKTGGFLTFNQYPDSVFSNTAAVGKVRYLRQGDSLPSSECYSGSCSILAAYLNSIGKWNSVSRTVTGMGACNMLAVTELESLSPANNQADYDDAVALLTFSPAN